MLESLACITDQCVYILQVIGNHNQGNNMITQDHCDNSVENVLKCDTGELYISQEVTVIVQSLNLSSSKLWG